MRKIIHQSRYCFGYCFEPEISLRNPFYTAAVVLTEAKTEKKLTHLISKKLDEINAFDLAESKGPYLGQLNLITVSSFIGPNGYLWGHEIAETENIRDHLMTSIRGIKVFSAEPLIEASLQLFGTRDKQHFPPIPGAHTPCAAKSIEKLGPCYIYGGIGIGIVKDRTLHANLLMEDIGYAKDINEQTSISEENQMQIQIARSLTEIAKNQNVALQEIFVSTRKLFVAQNEVGCILAAVPYVTLPKVAFPPKIKDLSTLSLSEWTEQTEKHFICNNY